MRAMILALLREARRTLLELGFPGVYVVALATLVFVISCAPKVPDPAEQNHVPKLEDHHAMLRTNLRRLIGLTIKEALQQPDLAGYKSRYWTDEPPNSLRGMVYYLPAGDSITLFIHHEEPMYRLFSEDRDWDHEAFLRCKIGGVLYEAAKADGIAISIGDDVPWQWRPDNHEPDRTARKE